MIVINADDWGRSVEETDAARACHDRGSITSVTAMVFMDDSRRAAELALERGLAVGLHLNLSQPYAQRALPEATIGRQGRVCRFMTASRYAVVMFNPARHVDIAATYQDQVDEFRRLYGRVPTHIDGHHHKHLCANILLGDIIPSGQRVRRGFHFWPGEKSLANRAVRKLADRLLERRYETTDYFFAMSQCLQPERLARVLALAASHDVEVMAHPAVAAERRRLTSARFLAQIAPLQRGSYAALGVPPEPPTGSVT